MILAILITIFLICALMSWLGKRMFHVVTAPMFIAFFIFQWVFTRIPRKESNHV